VWTSLATTRKREKPMVFKALAAAPTFSGREGAIKIKISSITPPVSGAPIYRRYQRITSISLSESLLVIGEKSA